MRKKMKKKKKKIKFLYLQEVYLIIITLPVIKDNLLFSNKNYSKIMVMIKIKIK